jgi:hypothetical protein
MWIKWALHQGGGGRGPIRARQNRTEGTVSESTESGSRPPGVKLIFESYGRVDAAELAERLHRDLEADGFAVWRDTAEITRGSAWATEIERAIATSDVLMALLSPHAVRSGSDPNNPDGSDSVCLDEIFMARFGKPPRPIVPVMAVSCQPPLPIFRLDYVDLTKWQDEESYQVGLAGLKKGIMAALANRVMDRTFVAELDPFDFGAFLNAKRKDFGGRDWLFADIEDWRKREGERALLITGDPGSGKSALVAELVYRNPGGQVVAYHCCQSNVPDTCQPGKFVRSIAAMLASQIPDYATAIERGRPLDVLTQADADPETAFEYGIIGPLCSIASPGGVTRYILIDALDEAIAVPTSYRGATILDLLALRIEQLPEWLRLVATSRHERAVLERFRGIRTISVSARDPRNRDDIEQYVRRRLSDPRFVALIEKQHAEMESVCAELCALSDGSFLYAQQALESLGSELLLFSQLAAQPPGLWKLYDDFFDRTFPDDASYANTKELLSVLLSAHGGLTVNQLCKILGVTAVVLEQLLAPLSGYVTNVEDRLTLFHKSLTDWITDPQKARLRFVIEVGGGQARLLEYCQRWSELDDDYPLRELPGCLAESGDIDGMLNVLSDPSFEGARRARKLETVSIEDYRQLTTMLLSASRFDDLVALSTTLDTYRRDGVAIAMREAGAQLDASVRSANEALVAVGSRHKRHQELNAAQVNAVLIAIRTASERGYGEQLVTLTQIESAKVRVMLVPYLFRYWKARREEGWDLLDQLAPHFTGRFGAPREEMVEVIGGLALAIVSAFFDDEVIMARLGTYLAGLFDESLRSPLRRTLVRSGILKVGIAALTKVVKEQPEYQPVNLPEMNQSFPQSPAVNAIALPMLDILEQPERDVDEIVELLNGADPGFDLLLMMVVERALQVKGAGDPSAAMGALERLFHQGYPWLRQSMLYAAGQILGTSDLKTTDPVWLGLFADLTLEFIRADRAVLVTKIGTYSVPTAMATIESVFERHVPTGTARFIPAYFDVAIEEGDMALALRVIKATDLLSFLGEPLIALDALSGIVDATLAHPELTTPVVEVLANIRMFEDASVDRLLARKNRPDLTTSVLATPPSLSANEFPGMVDFFANHQLITSEDGRREICGMFRKVTQARSSAEVVHDIIVWLIGLLLGE